MSQAPPPGWGAPAATGWAEPTTTQPAVPAAYQVPPGRPQEPPYLPPPGYDEQPYGQAPGGPPGFQPFQPFPSADCPPGGGPPPGGPLLPGPVQAPPRQPPRRHDRNRSGTPLAVWVIVLVILFGGGAVAGVLLARSSGHPAALRQTASTDGKATASAPASQAGSGPASPAPSPSAAASAPAVTQQQAATHVGSLLNQSVSDRAAINQAYDHVLTCSPQMASAPTVFTSAANSRQKLLDQLGSLPGRAELPPPLLSDLSQAWQASIAADRAFAQWATDELAACTPNDTGSPAYQGTVTPDANATKYKTLFVAQWNKLAAKYGLTQYTQDQL